MHKSRKTNFFIARIPGLLLVVLLITFGMPAAGSFVYAENPGSPVTLAYSDSSGNSGYTEDSTDSSGDPPGSSENSTDSSGDPPGSSEDSPVSPEHSPVSPDYPPDSSPAGLLSNEENADTDEDVLMEQASEPESPEPYGTVDATIDLSEAHNVNLQSTLGYEIKGLDSLGRTYSYFKPSLHDSPLTDPFITNGRIDFYSNANGKTFRLIQTGVRTENSKLTKNGTTIIPLIYISQNVKNITLILEDIDLGQHAVNNSVYGYISINANSTVTLLLETDAGNPSIGSSYIRTTLRVPSSASLTIDSLSSQGSSSGTLTVTPTNADAAAIGGYYIAGADTSGQIIINGGTVNASQTMSNSTGAAIGGGGLSVSSSASAGGGNVTINGGTVNAVNSGRGAAIGGGGVRAYNTKAGVGTVTITGGTVNATNTGFGAAIGGGGSLYTDNVTAGSGAAGGCSISITGGVVTATADKGAAIGGGQAGSPGNLSARTVEIGAGANIKAFSSGVNTVSGIYTAYARPAIDIGTLSDSGYFVNARINPGPLGNDATKLQIRGPGGGPVIDSLILPANYRCFAYSTGTSRVDNIIVFNAASTTILGSLRHDDTDMSFDIFSINNAAGYNQHGDSGFALLSVTMDPVNIPLSPRYHVYRGSPDTGLFVASRYLLADAVAQCTTNNSLYTIVATEHDPNMTEGGNSEIPIPANRIITITSSNSPPQGSWIITRQGTGRHFNISGSLTLENIVLDGDGNAGGITSSGVLAMNSGATIQNCRAANGGAVYVNDGSFTMTGTAKLSGNTAGLNGQGNGGAVYVRNGAFNVGDATNSGIKTAPVISGNKAPYGHGGGIYTAGYLYTRIGSDVLFSGNSASEGYDLGLTANSYAIKFSNIFSPYGQYYSFPSSHPVNNYDVNVIFYTLTVHYVDKNNNKLTAPPPISATSKAYTILAEDPFELDSTGDRIIPHIAGYLFIDWAVNMNLPGLSVGDTHVTLDSVPMDMDIFLIYDIAVTTNVTVSSSVAGNYADKTKEFLITVSLYYDAPGHSPLPAGMTFPFTGDTIQGESALPPESGYLKLDKNGADTFLLSHGQKITIQGIPQIVYIRITCESDTYRYTPAFKDSKDAGVTSGNDTDIRLVGPLPRSFDFVYTMETIVPVGIRDETRESLSALLLTAALLLSALAATWQMRRRLPDTT